MTVIDAAHTPGKIDLALDALGADFYTSSIGTLDAEHLDQFLLRLTLDCRDDFHIWLQT
jgi:hypothetical protein